MALGLNRVLSLLTHRSAICYGSFWSPETLETLVDSYLDQAHTGYRA